MKNTKNKSMKKIVNLVVCSLVLVGGSSIQAATIGVGTAFGTFLSSTGAELTAGGVSIGFFTGTLPTAATIAAMSNNSFSTFRSTFGYVDVRTMLDANGLAPTFLNTGWDFAAGWTGDTLTVPAAPSNSPATAYNQVDVLAAFAAGSTTGTALWAIAYNGGNYANGYSGSTQWAVVTATAPGGSANDWIYPSSSENIQLSQINATGEVLIGTDPGNSNVLLATMIPEPSSASLLAIGVAGLVALRVRRKS